MIALEEGKEKVMHIYKCYQNLIFRVKSQQRDISIEKGIFPCKKTTQIIVNSPVKLTEAFELSSFLVVRFRSENSVVYYKIDKSEFSYVEINLKGYDPSKVYMIESNSNTIVICHFKSTSVQPYMIFALTAESLRRIQIPNINQLIQPDINIEFIAGGLEINRGEISLYVGIKYPDSVSFLKYTLDIDHNNAVLSRSAYNLLGNQNLEYHSVAMCFLKDKVVILDPQPRVIEERKELRLYVIDGSNPTLDASYPLAEYNIQYLTSPVLICNPDKDLIILRGHNYLNDKNVTAYLNGNFQEADNRVIQVIEDKIGAECALGKIVNYFVEYCATTNSSSTIPHSLRFNRNLDPRVVILHRQADESDSTLTITNQKSTHTVNFTVKSVKPFCSLDARVKSKFSEAVLREDLADDEIRRFSLVDEALDYDCHLLQVEIATSTGGSYQPPDPTKARVKREVLVHRINEYLAFGKYRDQTQKQGKGMMGFDRIVTKGKFIGTLSINSKFHTLSTWFSIGEVLGQD